MGTNNNKKKLNLLTSDGKIVQAEESAVRKLEKLLESSENNNNNNNNSTISVPGVRAKALRRILVWCKRHAAMEAKVENKNKKKKTTLLGEKEKIEKWDLEFAEGLGDVFVLEVALAADQLGVTELVSLAMGRIAKAIADMSVEQVEEAFCASTRNDEDGNKNM